MALTEHQFFSNWATWYQSGYRITWHNRRWRCQQSLGSPSLRFSHTKKLLDFGELAAIDMPPHIQRELDEHKEEYRTFLGRSVNDTLQPYAWHLMLSSPELSRVFNMAIEMKMRALARNTFCGWVVYGSEVYHAKEGENVRNKPDESIAPILQTKGYSWE